jgi:hypothetical protein
MVKTLLISISIFLFLACQTAQTQQTAPSDIVCQLADSAKFQSVIRQLGDRTDQPMGKLVADVGKQFLGVAYAEQTLEHGKDEPLTVELEGLDCTTFAETALAIARTLKSEKPDFSTFARELENLRYREGKRDGYLSRLHYFSDWIYDNEQKGLISQPTNDFGQPLDLFVNFMSTHPESYPVLNGNPELVSTLAEQEKVVSARNYFFVTKEEVESKESNLKEGDLVGLATSIKGLDVTHVGILVEVGSRIHLMHASTASNQVVISDEPLADFLQAKKSYTGILVARPID